MITAKIETSDGVGAKAAALIFVLLLTIASVSVGAMVAGYVLHVLWGWFVAPLFGVPVITIAQALGLMLVVRSFVGLKYTPQTDKPYSTLLAEATLRPLVVGAVVLGVGMVVKGFI